MIGKFVLNVNTGNSAKKYWMKATSVMGTSSGLNDEGSKFNVYKS